MPEIVKVDTEAELIEVCSTGHVSKSDLYGTLEAVAGYYRQYNIKKLLIDATAQVALPPVGDLYQFVTEMAKQGVKIKQAVVVSASTPEKVRFVDDVANNRGVKFKVFTSRLDALEWLG
jgi:hypothetical protein